MVEESSEELRFSFVEEVEVAVVEGEDETSVVKSTRRTIDRVEAPMSAEVLRARIEALSAIRTGKPVRQIPGDEDVSPIPVSDKDLEYEESSPHVDEALTIAGFYQRVRAALAQEFTNDIWVVGEIRGLRESRGHRYLELADAGTPEGRGVAQQLEVVCWAREWPRISHSLSEAGVNLEVGRVVRVRGRVSIWEGGSKLRFTLTGLDVEALLGGIAAARRRLIQTLSAEGLFDRNRTRDVPLVPLRIGVVTSPGSEAQRDFVGQLERSGFAFDIRFESSLVQGPAAPEQIAEALGRLEHFAPDVAVVVRGGGARGDLAAFDAEEVARAIAGAPFPVWTGIGHTGDRSVADEVANQALITPTACGEAIVDRVAEYWFGVVDRASAIAAKSQMKLDAIHDRWSERKATLANAVSHQLSRRDDELVSARATLGRCTTRVLVQATTREVARAAALRTGAGRALSREHDHMLRRRQVLAAYDPARQMERGWSLTRDSSGRVVTSVGSVREGELLSTRLRDGEIASRIEALVESPVRTPVEEQPGD